jgi:hypothetical protein
VEQKGNREGVQTHWWKTRKLREVLKSCYRLKVLAKINSKAALSFSLSLSLSLISYSCTLALTLLLLLLLLLSGFHFLSFSTINMLVSPTLEILNEKKKKKGRAE